MSWRHPVPYSPSKQYPSLCLPSRSWRRSGATRGLGIMGYSAAEKVYLYYGVENNPMAMTTVPRGTVEGDTWTYQDESKMGDQVVKSRYVIKQLDKKSYTFKYEMQGPDGQWKTVVEGKSTRS